MRAVRSGRSDWNELIFELGVDHQALSMKGEEEEQFIFSRDPLIVNPGWGLAAWTLVQVAPC